MSGKLHMRKGWNTVRFGDVVKDVKESEKNPLEVGLDRYIGLEHIEPENLHIKQWGDLNEDQVSFTKHFRKGQVLFGKRRAYQRKVAVAEFDGICSSDILTFEPNGDDLLPELLPFIVQSDAFFEHALDTSSGSLSPRTRWSQLKEFEFPLPPKDEQRRIAEMLWQFDHSTELYRKAAIDCECLIRVLTKTALNAILIKYPLKPLLQLLSPDRPLCYGIVQPGEFVQHGVPFIRVCDMEGEKICVDELERVSEEVHDQYRRSVVQEGDVIVSVVGTIGRCKRVSAKCNGFNIARAVARLAPCDQLDADYLITIMASDQYQRRLVGDSVETARKTLNLKTLGELQIPYPSVDVQKKIAAPILASKQRLRKIFSHIKKLDSTAKALRNSHISLEIVNVQ